MRRNHSILRLTLPKVKKEKKSNTADQVSLLCPAPSSCSYSSLLLLCSRFSSLWSVSYSSQTRALRHVSTLSDETQKQDKVPPSPTRVGSCRAFSLSDLRTYWCFRGYQQPRCSMVKLLLLQLRHSPLSENINKREQIARITSKCLTMAFKQYFM